MAPFPAPETGIVLTHFIVSGDIARSRDFYANVLGGEVVSEGPVVVALANSWIIINTGGGPTDDKPAVTLTAPDPNTTSSFLNIRVANIQEIYDDWSAKGAQFLTPPVDHGVELRCYLHDPDGHLIEVGQANRDFLNERGLLGCRRPSQPSKMRCRRSITESASLGVGSTPASRAARSRGPFDSEGCAASRCNLATP
jgi:catechol 2,3-dioxygenase-like lactoylglutathione lyase family enzyme